MAFLDSLNTKL